MFTNVNGIRLERFPFIDISNITQDLCVLLFIDQTF